MGGAMSGLNHVELRGVVHLRKMVPPKDGKKALAFGSIKPDERGPFFDVKCFDQAASDFANADGLVVTISGRLDFDKPKDPKQKPWPMVIIVEKVIEHAPVPSEPF